MKLYYAPGTCSLAPHIVALEAGISLELERVDLSSIPHRTERGRDYTEINLHGYVPALELDDGTVLTEGAAILQYLADRVPDSLLAPPAGSLERYRLQQWLIFIATELHKMFSPWLFHPEYGSEAQAVVRSKLEARFHHLDQTLASTSFLLGDRFTAADAYCFAIVGWSRRFQIDLTPYPHLGAYLHRVNGRPRVREAVRAHVQKSELSAR